MASNGEQKSKDPKDTTALARADAAAKRALAFDVTAGGLQLRTFQDVERFGKAMIDSGFAPKGFTRASQVVHAIQRGSELKLSLAASLSAFYVSPGNRLSLYAEAALAVLRKGGDGSVLEPNDRKEFVGPGEDRACIWTFRRRGWAKERWEQSKFSIREARVAQLIKRDSNWEKYPDRMLWARVVAFGCKDWFSDVMLGIEIIDPSEVVDVTPGPAPAPAPGSSPSSVEPTGEPLLEDEDAPVDATYVAATPSGTVVVGGGRHDTVSDAPPAGPEEAPVDPPEEPLGPEERWARLLAEVEARTIGDAGERDQLAREIESVYGSKGIDAAERALIEHAVFGGPLQGELL
jgi:hypothetical protein